MCMQCLLGGLAARCCAVFSLDSSYFRELQRERQASRAMRTFNRRIVNQTTGGTYKRRVAVLVDGRAVELHPYEMRAHDLLHDRLGPETSWVAAAWAATQEAMRIIEEENGPVAYVADRSA